VDADCIQKLLGGFCYSAEGIFLLQWDFLMYGPHRSPWGGVEAPGYSHINCVLRHVLIELVSLNGFSTLLYFKKENHSYENSLPV